MNRQRVLSSTIHRMASLMLLAALLSSIPPARAAGPGFLSPGAHVNPAVELSNQVYCPLIARSCNPLYMDDFSNPASGWPLSDTKIHLLEYSSGEYRMLERPAGRGDISRSGYKAQADFGLSVDVRNVSNVPGFYGIVFGIPQNWLQYYTFEISPDGNWRLRVWNKGYDTLQDSGVSSFIHKGTASNRLKVETLATGLKLYINGHLLDSEFMPGYDWDGYVGLVAFSTSAPNLDVRFDNFVVFIADCPPIGYSQ